MKTSACSRRPEWNGIATNFPVSKSLWDCITLEWSKESDLSLGMQFALYYGHLFFLVVASLLIATDPSNSEFLGLLQIVCAAGSIKSHYFTPVLYWKPGWPAIRIRCERGRDPVQQLQFYMEAIIAFSLLYTCFPMWKNIKKWNKYHAEYLLVYHWLLPHY